MRLTAKNAAASSLFWGVACCVSALVLAYWFLLLMWNC